jgi:hypothetical protein
MPDEKRNDSQSLLEKLVAFLVRSPWREVLGEAWKILRQVMQRRSFRGVYEVLRYESTLELKDRGGKRATFKKPEKVRYLQDNVIAYQGQAEVVEQEVAQRKAGARRQEKGQGKDGSARSLQPRLF